MTGTDGGAPREQLDDGWIHDDVRCDGCGYRLTATRADGDCPECGTSVARSHYRWMLRTASPKWLRVLAVGAVLVMLASIAFGLLILDAAYLEWLSETDARWLRDGAWWTVWGLLSAGLLALTARLRGWLSLRQATRRRLAARWLSLLTIALVLIPWAYFTMPREMREELAWRIFYGSNVNSQMRS